MNQQHIAFYMNQQHIAVFKCTLAYMRAVIQGQRGILHSRFKIKYFICSQCNRNYIFSVQINIRQQINSLKTHFTDENITIL